MGGSMVTTNRGRRLGFVACAILFTGSLIFLCSNYKKISDGVSRHYNAISFLRDDFVFSKSTFMEPGFNDVPRIEEEPVKIFNSQLASKKKLEASGKNVDILFYGDSAFQLMIEEYHHGSYVLEGHKEMFDKWFGAYTTDVYAVAGDRTDHLRYKLEHGFSPKNLKPQFIVLLIGTNDVAAIHLERYQDMDHEKMMVYKATVAYRVLSLIEFLHLESPSTKILCIEMLPRANLSQAANFLIAKDISQQTKILREALSKKSFAQFISCHDFFMADGKLDRKLMKDATHPNDAGYEKLFQCIMPVLKKEGLR